MEEYKMKKKLFILIIILVAFISGICANYFISKNNQSNLETVEPQKKERQFDSLSDVPVSNSNTQGSKIVFKSFFAYDESLDLSEFLVANEELYYKKIISYDEYLKYKEIIPELRTLTEDDFVNYYLIIALSKNVDSIYMYNKIEESEDSISLEILKNQRISETESQPLFSGVAVILPNITEVPDENISFIIEENSF